MQELVALTLASCLGNLLGRNSTQLADVPLVSWQQAKIFEVPTTRDRIVEAIVTDYLRRLAQRGFDPRQQGIMIQSEWSYLGQYRETIPASAASLTKIATSLAALDRWGTDHRFETRIYSTGTLQNGVLQGDLVIEGGGDPLFVWEEAIALANQLNTLEIYQITGDLMITGDFDMNFQEDPQRAGKLLKLAFDARQWTPEIEKQYQALPPNTPRPQIAIKGSIRVSTVLPVSSQLLLRHQSLTVAELLKQMNLYSNNVMAETIAQSLGGATMVANTAAKAANVPLAEIQLINGSGLGVENRISPRAAVRMLMAIERKLADNTIKVADLLPMGGRDTKGTMQLRAIPLGVAIKTGTLAQVSALAGVIPTKERGQVWFAMINYGNNIEQFRQEQDRFLQRLALHWQLMPVFSVNNRTKAVYLGDPGRNLFVNQQVRRSP